jgi:WXXGXW repeat (2 copies)
MRIISSIRSLFFTLVMVAVPSLSFGQVLAPVNFGPPALPVYEQPLCPAEGYIWTPGYWAYSSDGYYWVPGTWVMAPEQGLLWTPGYWAFDDGLYYWNPGYWSPVVGYYGGIDYGYGYPGNGFYGGYWRGRQFFYNQSVNNVNVTNVHHVYNETIVNTTSNVNRVSYNGGPGGTKARRTREQEATAGQQQVPPTSVQMQHEHAASTNRNLLASVNHGQPPIAATPKPAEFSGRGAIAASRAGAPYEPPDNRAAPSQRGTRTPRAENTPENQPRSSEPMPRRKPTPEVPRPPSASEQNAPRPENAPYPERQARPENAPRPRNEPPPNSSTQPNRKTRPDYGPPPPNAEQNRPPLISYETGPLGRASDGPSYTPILNPSAQGNAEENPSSR